MGTSPDLSLIVPAFDEARTIGRELDVILSYLAGRSQRFELIVSVDGTDGTREQALARARSDERVRVVWSASRRGKGRAVREAAALADGKWVGYLDADGKTPIQELEKLIECLERGCDVAIGSRALPESQLEARRPLLRRLGSLAFTALVHGLIGLRDIRDMQCGFKLLRQDAAREVFARQRIDGYAFDVELLCLARALGYRLGEVPIRWRGDADTRFAPVSGGWRILLDLWRIRAGAGYGGEAMKSASTASAARR